MQGTWVRSLSGKDSTCFGPLNPVSHDFCAHKPHLMSPHAATTEAQAPRDRALQRERSHSNKTAVKQHHESALLTATRESPHAAVRMQHNQL